MAINDIYLIKSGADGYESITTGSVLNFNDGRLNFGVETTFTGNVRILGGNPGAGKFLISDSIGNTSWLTFAGVTGTGTIGNIPIFNGTSSIGNSPITYSDPTITLSGQTNIHKGNGNIALAVGGGGVGNRSATFVLIGDNTYNTTSNPGFSIARGNGGADTTTTMFHQGTANFEIYVINTGSRVNFQCAGGGGLNALQITNEGAFFPARGGIHAGGYFVMGANVGAYSKKYIEVQDDSFIINNGLSTGQTLLDVNSQSVGIGINANDARLRIRAGNADFASIRFESGTQVTTQTAGYMEYFSGIYFLSPANRRRPISLCAGTINKDDTLANGPSLTINLIQPGSNEFVSGRMIRSDLLGKYRTNNGTDTFSAILKIDGIAVITGTSVAASVVDKPFRITPFVTFRTNGASGSYAAYLDTRINNTDVTPAPTTGYCNVAGNPLISLEFTWSANNTGNVISLQQKSVEILN